MRLVSSSDHWPVGVGALVREARTAQGLTVDQLSLLSDVPERYLAALEAGDYGRFATPLYAVAYARACAAALGISEAWIDVRLRAELGEAAVPVAPPARTAGSARWMRMMIGGVIGAGLVTLALMVA